MTDLLNQLSTLPPLEHALTILLVLISFFSLMFVIISLAFKLTTEKYEQYKEINKQYKEEFQTMTKQFLEETPREFLRLNNFKVVEQ